MTRLVTWLLAALLLLSAAPAAAQSTDQLAPAQPPAAPLPVRTNFPYGVLVADLSDAPRAHEAGFRVMALTLSWRRTQPTRGQYPFEQQDQYGQTAANDLTNMVDAAANNGLKLGIRLIDPPEWAGGSPAHVNPADLEDYAYHAVLYAHDTLAYFELFNEQNLASEWGGPPDPAAYAGLMAAAYRGVKRAGRARVHGQL